MSLLNKLVEMGILDRQKPGFKACSIEERRMRLNACQRARRQARRDAKANGVPWIPKHIGRPPKYSTLEEELEARRAISRATKIRQTKRTVEAIQRYVNGESDTMQSTDSAVEAMT